MMRPSGERTQRSASSPISLRLTADERVWLEAEAGTRTLSTYVRERLFDSKGGRRLDRRPSHNARALAQVLAALGQSGIVESLRELSRQAEIGALVLTPETEAALKSACEAIERMRRDLMDALGLIETDRP